VAKNDAPDLAFSYVMHTCQVRGNNISQQNPAIATDGGSARNQRAHVG
jgi:hypothetical protein